MTTGAAGQPVAASASGGRILLVRSVSGPARIRVGEVAIYKATGYNVPDPTPQEKAGINWDVASSGQTMAEFRAAGETLQLDITAKFSGKTIRVRPFCNPPTDQVSVVTSVPAITDAIEMAGTDTTMSQIPKVVSLEREERRFFVRIDGGPRFVVGSDVFFEGHRGLMNTRDASGNPYKLAGYRDRFGFWADFIYLTALCESSGFFQRLNTYDAARFTFGFFRHAAHTPNDNFILLLRQLLGLPLASAYFPELTLHNGAIHRVTASGLERLETDNATEGLMGYLNPSRDVVDDREVINAAKCIHWSLHDPAHRDLQVAFTISQQRQKMAQYGRIYPLNGLVDTVCLVVADIRHQGRAKSRHIIEVLESQDTLNHLLEIGAGRFRECISTLRAALGLVRGKAFLGNADTMPL